MFFYVIDFLFSIPLITNSVEDFLLAFLISGFVSLSMRGYESQIILDPKERKISFFGSLVMVTILFFVFTGSDIIILLPALLSALFRYTILFRFKRFFKLRPMTVDPGTVEEDFQELVHVKTYDGFKRFLDFVFGVVFLILLTPIFLIIAVLILITSGRPVFITQDRMGRNEKVFKMLKFRTFTNGEHHKRITRVGKILRPLRLDELPQIINIILGEMSLVGPRPELKAFHEMGKKHVPNYKLRLLVRPGLTGWAQINYKYTTTPEEYMIKTSYDLYYVLNRSLKLDILCLLKTPYAVIKSLVSKDF